MSLLRTGSLKSTFVSRMEAAGIGLDWLVELMAKIPKSPGCTAPVLLRLAEFTAAVLDIRKPMPAHQRLPPLSMRAGGDTVESVDELFAPEADADVAVEGSDDGAESP